MAWSFEWSQNATPVLINEELKRFYAREITFDLRFQMALLVAQWPEKFILIKRESFHKHEI